MGNTDSGKQIDKKKDYEKKLRKNPNGCEGRNNKSYTHIQNTGKYTESKRAQKKYISELLSRSSGKDLKPRK